MGMSNYFKPANPTGLYLNLGYLCTPTDYRSRIVRVAISYHATYQLLVKLKRRCSTNYRNHRTWGEYLYLHLFSLMPIAQSEIGGFH